MKDTGKNIKALFELDPSAIICLYKIDLKGKGQYLFHAGENGYKNNIVFNSQEYDFFPIKADGFETQGDGRLPRPKLTFTNHQGVISLRLNYFEDFINYKVTRIKTFVKYLDAVNFPNNFNPHAEPDPDAAFGEDVFFVNQKTKEDDNIVEFELVSLLELQNASVPARTVYSNSCPWQYRGDIGCGYKGKPISDGKNKRFVPSGYNEDMVGSEVYFSGEFKTEEFAKFEEGNIYSDWSITSTYSKGDTVKLVPYDHDSSLNPIDIYVCLNDGVRSNPIYDTENWVLDDCDRSLCGCRLRFSDLATGAGGGKRITENPEGKDQFWTESEEGLPFGGFPGVDPYEFK
jgi:lambda family phage minor tail protein L